MKFMALAHIWNILKGWGLLFQKKCIIEEQINRRMISYDGYDSKKYTIGRVDVIV